MSVRKPFVASLAAVSAIAAACLGPEITTRLMTRKLVTELSYCLGDSRKPGFRDRLLFLISFSRPNSRRIDEVIADLADIGEPAVAALIERLESCPKNDAAFPASDGPAYCAALEALGPPAVRPLVRMLTKLSPDGQIVARMNITETLGNMGPVARGAIPTLQAALGSPHALVRGSAAAALAQIDPSLAQEAALPGVLADASSRDRLAQYGASLALRKIGPATPEAAQAIRALARAPSWRQTDSAMSPADR